MRELRAARPRGGEERQHDRRDPGARERGAALVRAAKRAPDGERDRRHRDQRPNLHQERQRSARYLLQEHVADDAEAGDEEGERRGLAREGQRKAVRAEQGGDDAEGEPVDRAHRAVGHQRPAERGQLARAVQVDPGRKRLGCAPGKISWPWYTRATKRSEVAGSTSASSPRTIASKSASYSAPGATTPRPSRPRRFT